MVAIENIDDSNDLEENAKEFSLDAGDDKIVEVGIRIPLEVDEKTYNVVINIKGKDEKGEEHSVKWTLELKVDKEKHNVVINKFSLNSTIISCNRNIELNAELVNLGSEDEEKVVLEILNIDLGININEKDVELEEGTDDNRYGKSFTIKIDDDALAGSYPILINAYYHDGGLSDSKIVDLIIQDCEKSKEIKEKVKAEVRVIAFGLFRS